MEKKEILNGNIEISKFMGYEYSKTQDCGILSGNKFTKDPQGNVSYGHHCFINYHSSWDKLIPVLNKIKIIFNENKYISRTRTIYFADYNLLDLEIEDVYYTTIDFIQWYNKNK